MMENQKIYMPSLPLVSGSDRYGQLSNFEPGTQILKAGSQLTPAFRPLTVDIVFEKDVAVTLRDGTLTHVDLFRPVGTDQVPVIVAFSPYGKGQGTSPSAMGVFSLVGLENSILSGLAKFEGPDPAFWCAQGYAICNPDIRGVANSGGDSVLWDRQEGQDAYDLIEWLGVQEWCNGNVAMSGTSYLAASQWFTAAEQPPHLAAINPWEGMSDTYRDLVLRGGMPDIGFAQQLRDYSFWGNGLKEDILAEAELYPLINDLWKNKIPDYARITVPAYVVSSYSNTLHTQGTFRAWRRLASENKWLRIHNSQEWPDYYDEANREDLLHFFDHFLKDIDNGWEHTPRVRYSLLDLEGGDEVAISADQFPPKGVTSKKLYLNSDTRALSSEEPPREATVRYVVGANPGSVSFIHRFDEKTTLVGYPKAHLWVEVVGADDMDLFVLVQKLDVYGTPLAQFTVPNNNARLHDATEFGGSILRYRGSDGRLRVSLRELDEGLSTSDVPFHTFSHSQKLAAGEIVDVQIDMLPLGLVFYPGEQLRFIVGGRSLLGTMMPGMPEYISPYSGTHILHTGGDHASYLQLPYQTQLNETMGDVDNDKIR
jgi:predicted acyl esterase